MKKEIDHVRNYLSLTELRYPNTLQYELEIQPETDTAQVPPLMIQTFIENTIKHETVPGEPMEIHLSVSLYWQGSERKDACLHLGYRAGISPGCPAAADR